MSRLIEMADVTGTHSSSRIGFATEGNENWPVWDRFITVDGKKAHYIGNVCGTCEFLFERLEGANTKISPETISNQCRDGISSLNTPVLNAVTALLPAGEYKALLLSCEPRLIVPSRAGDYFFEEQLELWGLDSFWGVPHYTKNEYYRTEILRMPEHAGLFEFIVPMFPRRYLDPQTIQSYEPVFSHKSLPTALAVSVLDVKQPADWEGHPEIREHWCLAHYLLDGHHKMSAAAALGQPISLLSFLAVKQGVSSLEQIDRLFSVLKKTKIIVF
jgi:hypothetical protein